MTETIADATKLAEITHAAVKPENTKGYWTEDPAGFLDFAVISDTDGPLIVLSSKFWYRVQYFKLAQTCDTATAWTYVKTLLKQCGRTLPPVTANETGNVYRITNLSLQQANQMYYLLKHSLTSENVEFQLRHSFSLDAASTLPAPVELKKKNRRKRPNKSGWQVVGGTSKLYQTGAGQNSED